jgi:hypothetical protein
MKTTLVMVGAVALIAVAATAVFVFPRRNEVTIEAAEGAETGARAR